MKERFLVCFLGLFALTALACDDDSEAKKFSASYYCEVFDICGGYEKWHFKNNADCTKQIEDQLSVFRRCEKPMQEFLSCRSSLDCNDVGETSLDRLKILCPDEYEAVVDCGYKEYPHKGNILAIDFSKIECSEDETPTCDGNYIKLCVGGEYKYDNCGDNATCEKGVCKENKRICTENEAKCKSSTTVSVCHNNQWIDSDCPGNYTCKNNQCSAPAGTCLENDAYCLGDTSINICHGGQWVSSLCPTGSTCVVNACRGSSNPGTPSCDLSNNQYIVNGKCTDIDEMAETACKIVDDGMILDVHDDPIYNCSLVCDISSSWQYYGCSDIESVYAQVFYDTDEPFFRSSDYAKPRGLCSVHFKDKMKTSGKDLYAKLLACIIRANSKDPRDLSYHACPGCSDVCDEPLRTPHPCAAEIEAIKDYED